MEEIKGPMCHTEVGERNFKGTYFSPYNNQEHKCYECLNYSVPNRERLFVEIEWKHFHGDYSPHHFLRFSKSSLEKALNFSGFKDIEVYKLDFPFIELFLYLEKKLFGDLDKLKIKLKGMMLGDERKARAYGVEELVKVSPSKGKAYILMMLKFLRNATLLPFALGYARKLKENGLSLYFQAKV